MNCQKCGSPLIPGDKFCKTCGTAVTAIQDNNQPIMNQMPSGMEMGTNNNNMQQEQKQHPLMMNQADLNMNAMSMNNNQNNNNQMNMNNQQDTMSMGNNQFVPSGMNNSMDNNMNSMNTMNNMNDMNTMSMGMNNNNNNNNMNTMSMGMNNNMNSLNNGMSSIPTPPPGMNAMNTPMSIGPMGTMTPQNNNTKFIIAGIAVVAVVLVVVFMMFGGTSLGGTKVGKGDGDTQQSVPTYTVKLSGFAFKIPQTYIYEITNGYLNMSDETDTWALRISVQKLSYENLKKNMDQLKPTAEKKGYTAERAELKTFNGVEMIKFNFEANGLKYNGAYAKVNSMYMATVEGFTEDNTYDEDLLKRASAIIKTAEYVGETANIELAIPDAATELLQLQ